MAYRTSSCAFCREVARTTCARCESNVCGAHSLASGSSAPPAAAPWCAACEAERRFQVDLAVAEALLMAPPLRTSVDVEVDLLVNLGRLVANAVTRPFRLRRARRAAERAFEERPAAEVQRTRLGGRRAIDR